MPSQRKTCSHLEIFGLVLGGVGSLGGLIAYGALSPYCPSSDELNKIANQVATGLGYSNNQTICHGSFMPKDVMEKVSLSSFDSLYFDTHGKLFCQDKMYQASGVDVEYNYYHSYYEKSVDTNSWQRTHNPWHASDYIMEQNAVLPEKQSIVQQFNTKFQNQVNKLTYENFNPGAQRAALYISVTCAFVLIAIGANILRRNFLCPKQDSEEIESAVQESICCF